MKSAPRKQNIDQKSDFSLRLQELIGEFGTRYALSKATGLAISSLQAYEAGSKPGYEALLCLARTANVSLDWLLTGKGKKRPTGILAGALLADVIMVDQYQHGTALNFEIIIGQIPFSRHLLENKIGLQEPTHKSLCAVEAQHNLSGIQRGDLVLVDLKQTGLIEDGVYLLNLPGLVLKEISVFPGDWVLLTDSGIEGSTKRTAISDHRSLKMRRSELLGDGQFSTSKVVGRAVWIGRGI